MTLRLEDFHVSPRAYNFNPGPAVLPEEVLRKASEEMMDFHGCGMSILEVSHRGPEYMDVYKKTIELFREVFGVPKEFHVLFLGGGASTQFFHIPWNLLGPGKKVSFLHTGHWSKLAMKEAKRFGEVLIAASTESENFTRLPRKEEIKIDPASTYVHLVSNNTIFGTQWQTFPDCGGLPVVADMSSDFMSRRIDFSKFDLIFGGAQKNLGPAGLTVVFIKDSLLSKCNPDVPTMVSHKTHIDGESAYNTPPVFAVYICNLVLEWVKSIGGMPGVEKLNDKKASMVYKVIDDLPKFYKGTVVDKGSRSKMNIPIRLPSEDLEKKFLKEAEAKKFLGLKGHRSVGGIRVSIYNAFPVEGVEKLTAFMRDFAKANSKA